MIEAERAAREAKRQARGDGGDAAAVGELQEQGRQQRHGARQRQVPGRGRAAPPAPPSDTPRATLLEMR